MKKFASWIPSILCLSIISVFLYAFFEGNFFQAGTLIMLFVLVFIVLYGLLISLSQKESALLVKYPFSFTPNRNDLLFRSVKVASPMYFCLLLISCIPSHRYEIWLMTVLPFLILICIPLYSL